MSNSEKIFMLNALWFKPQGGKEQYDEYIKLARPFMQAVGGKVCDTFQPQKAIIGDFDADLIFFVEYPNWESFKQFVNNSDYQKIAVPVREQAITRSLLVRCASIDLWS